MISAFGGISIVLLLAVYFVPTIVAGLRHNRLAAVLVINLLLGWTLLGWVAALVIAVWPKARVEYVSVPYTTTDEVMDALGATEAVHKA